MCCVLQTLCGPMNAKSATKLKLQTTIINWATAERKKKKCLKQAALTTRREVNVIAQALTCALYLLPLAPSSHCCWRDLLHFKRSTSIEILSHESFVCDFFFRCSFSIVFFLFALYYFFFFFNSFSLWPILHCVWTECFLSSAANLDNRLLSSHYLVIFHIAGRFSFKLFFFLFSRF